MRVGGVLIAAAIAIAGCDGGSSSSTAGVVRATFANLVGANTSGVAVSATFAACEQASGALSCSGSEAAEGRGRMVTVSFSGAVVVGMDYPIGGAQQANVLFADPTTFGTASGMRIWQAMPGTGTVRIVAWDPGAMHVGFSYAASMTPLGTPAAGTFDLTGDGNVNSLTTN